MGRRGRAGAIASGTAVGVAALFATSVEGRLSRACAAAPGKTHLETADVRVLERKARGRRRGETDYTLLVCRGSQRAPRVFARWTDGQGIYQSVARVAVAGPYVAIRYSIDTEINSGDDVTLYSARGKRFYSTSYDGSLDVAAGPVVTPSGGIAYTKFDDEGEGVDLVVADGDGERIAENGNITRLRAQGQRITWTIRGAERELTLRGRAE